MGQCNKTSNLCKYMKYAQLAFVLAIAYNFLDLHNSISSTNKTIKQNADISQRQFAYVVQGVNSALGQVYEWAQTVEFRLMKQNTEETK